MPHPFGKAPGFLDNPADTGNAADTRNIAAVAIASGRLQRGARRILGTAASGITGSGPADIVQKTYHKVRCPAIRSNVTTFLFSPSRHGVAVAAISPWMVGDSKL